MRMSQAVLTLAGASTLAGCGVRITELTDDDAIRRSSGATHTATLSVLRMGNPDAGYDRALKAALTTCGLTTDANPNDIRFKRGLAFYDVRAFTFECPEPGKEIQ